MLAIDQQTFRDLEVFEAKDGGQSLFGMLDLARTRGGASALRKRFLHPQSEPAKIRAVQQSVQYVMDHPKVFSAIPSEFVLSGFHNYYHWQITAPVTSRGWARASEMIQLRIDNSREYQQISMGVSHTLLILRALQSIVAETQTGVVPGELGVLLREIADLLQRPAFIDVPDAGIETWYFWTILNIDSALRKERQALHRLVRLLFEVDAIAAMARATVEEGLVIPDLDDGPAHVAADGLFHPFLSERVPNALVVDQHKRLLFITGPNMAGKTTYLRTCGVAIYLAHVGMGVPAKRFRFAPSDALFTSISLTDDIKEGISFFQAEALRARTIAEALAAGLHVTALMDEPFKGTNVKDALDASCAFFTRLARMEGSLFLVASHLIEASELLVETGQVECYHFAAQEQDGTLEFNYLLQRGVSSQRLGMRVLDEHGVFELLDRCLSATARG